jgi:serine/threonine-protein kinase
VKDAARRRRVEEVCDAALDLDAGERAVFIARACGDDEALRQAVEMFLAHARTADGFLAAPIGAVAAHVLGEAREASLLGRQIGSYTILAHLGAGGMGEVYRARDAKLGRDVAIKVLPVSFANDPDHLARLAREARLLAALNHPHIATIHGLEEADGVRALVMELVEGPTLAEKLTHDSQRKARAGLPLAEALTIGGQIAEALEAAHDKGVIHRDLKPANIKFSHDGHVKVLDFGLAKAFSSDGSGSDVSHLPSITATDLQAGVIVGTPAYMSPEQARGQAIDKRTDIWAFGCVLYEMLTGRTVFQGDTISDTIAALLEREPEWGVLPASTSTGIEHLLRRCLDKDPKHRLRDIGDARIEIDEALTTPSVDARAATVPSAQPRRWRRALPWAVAFGAAAVAAAVLLAPWALRQTVAPPAPLRLTADLGADASLATAVGQNATIAASVTLSPDGGLFAFVAQTTSTGTPQLYVRRLEELQATPLTGTDGAASPFFSPDGRWIAFFAQGKLKKIPVTGGPVVTLCDAANGRGGSWGDDGTIVFTPSVSESGLFLWRVPSGGGTPEPLSTPDGEATQRWAQVLPGSKAVLYTGNTGVGGYENANLVVQPLPAGARKIVLRGGYYGRYLPSGHLVYIHDGTLFAAPFDITRLEVTGQPVSALEGVASNPNIGASQFAVSDTGTIVYLPGRSTSGAIPIHLMDRSGKTTPLRAAPATWFNPAFAPDGRRLAMDIREGNQLDVWVYEWAGDTLSRLTLDPGEDRKPVWTPDGLRIVFSSNRAVATTPNLYWQRTDGTGEVQRLTDSKNRQFPWSWHPSGRFLAFTEVNPQTGTDTMILPMDGDEASGWKPAKPVAFLNSRFIENFPAFSPDGRWLAYASNESGRPEIYVRPFPGPGGKWQISTDGGTQPTWSRTQHELFYGALNNRMMVSSYVVDGNSFRAEKSRLWSEARYMPREAGQRAFDLHPDGTRFALAGVVETQAESRQEKVVFIFNFFDELRRIAPVSPR